MKLRGVVKGRTIVLDDAPELTDGERIEVEVGSVPEYSDIGLYQVSVRLAPGQADFGEKRKYERFPTSIFVEIPVVGAELVRAIQSDVGDIAGNDGAAEYKIELAHMAGPPVSPVCYKGKTYFDDAVRVPSHIYAKDLMRMMMKSLGVDESDTKIYGFNPRRYKGGKRATNELVNQIREELGI